MPPRRTTTRQTGTVPRTEQAARISQEKQQIPPPPRFDTGGSSSGKKNFSKGKGKQFKRSGTSSSSSSNESKQLRTGQKSDDYCTKCGGRHITEQCRGVFGLCNLCNKPGHFARVCLDGYPCQDHIRILMALM
ncbi:hypothetical protein F511_36257 [Dorcoceras hygrometricum]|uniref:CCHC-type domain-containing protein n=1 Tax=Dorcoceras hygrometricum TaxID=472368 RepID=A0A2Z7AJK0_9LAMI|nr:hypothetical protein F511_36257 [Dorcoceras hygrometricum]